MGMVRLVVAVRGVRMMAPCGTGKEVKVMDVGSMLEGRVGVRKRTRVRAPPAPSEDPSYAMHIAKPACAACCFVQSSWT